MLSRSLSKMALLIGVAGVLLAPATAAAQVRVGVGVTFPRGGVYYGPYPYGYYPGYYPRYYVGVYTPPGFYYTYYPRPSVGYYPPGYYPYAGANYPGYYPVYPPRSYAPGYYASSAPVGSYRALYPPGSSSPANNPGTEVDTAVHVSVRVPDPNAEIWFDGTMTTQTGTLREFVSPPLTPGRNYTYEVRARWMEDGREVMQTRNVTVRAGDWVRVDFSAPPSEE